MHSFQERRLVPAEEDEPGSRNTRKSILKVIPYAPFAVLVVDPKAVSNRRVTGSDATPLIVSLGAGRYRTLTFQRVDAIIFDHMCASALLTVLLGEDEF